jgi:hypothetical protein
MDNKLFLTKFDCQNQDLTFKEEPELIIANFPITINDKNNIVLFDGQEKYELTRIK